MGAGKVHYSDEYKAREAYAVFIRRERPSRSITRSELKEALADPAVYQDFLKICLEQDGRATFEIPAGFKKGIYCVLQSIGMAKVEREMGLSRVTLYRMFAPTGNPSLSTFMKVLRYLRFRLWVVEEDFVRRGPAFRRLKDEFPDELAPNRDPRVRLSRETKKGIKVWSFVEDK